MSGALLLRVNLSFRGEDLAEGTIVMANVYPVNRDEKALRGVLVPAGDEVPYKRFEMEPGRYVVEIVMPSGKLLTEEAEVTEGEELQLSIDDWDSPHESHSWQYLAGNLEPGGVYNDPSTVPIPRSSGSRYFDNLAVDVDEAGPPAPNGGRLQPPQVFWVPDSRTEGWSIGRLNELSEDMSEADLQRVQALVAEAEPVKIGEPTETDLTSHLYRFNRSGPLPPVSPAMTGARQFVLVMSAGDAFQVTLPTPWTDVHHNDAQVEILVNGRQSPTGSPVAVTVRDRALGTALGYLASGALSAAARVFEDVEGMLYGKVMNPLAAAAGAYVLVGTESDPSPKPWHDWLTNLRDWFGWMSDGAVLWGVHALRTAKTRAQVDEAKAALLDGYGRGVPFYTLGLSWLIDGLSRFPDDEQCQQKLDQVRRLLWRVDTRQPFVVLRLNGRSA